MKISDLLTNLPKSPVHDYRGLFLNGHIEPNDESGTFRLYDDPQNRRDFLVVRTEDVTGDIHEWSESELAASKRIGQKRFRVPLRHGAHVEAITIEMHRLGETLAGHDTLAGLEGQRGCRYTTGCDSRCCTSDGNKCYCDTCCIA